MAGPRFVVVLVEPKFAGNVGSVARAMNNFGLGELWLVKPACSPADDDAQRMAVHARPLLAKARTFASLEECLGELDLAVGTASDLAANEKRDYLRVPLRVRDFAERMPEIQGTVGLLFGREDFGLSNAELERCDMLVTIPASPAHPSLNLSHSVAVVCYELAQQSFHVTRPRQVSRQDADLLVDYVRRILDAMELPAHRQRITLLTFRKLLGRAMMSRWEYHRLMGVFAASLGAMEELRRQGKRVRGHRPARKARPPHPGASAEKEA